MADNPSLVALVDTLSRKGHRLKSIDDGALDSGLLSRLAERVADPPRPLRLTRFIGHFLPRFLATQSHRGRSKTAGKLRLAPGAIVLTLLAAPLTWHFTGLAAYADPDALRTYLADVVDSPFAPFLVVACFVLGGLIAFPMVVLILVTAALFGPWLGMAYAVAGIAASGGLFYAVGVRVGSDPLKRLAGNRWPRLRGRLQKRGLLAVVALRVLPMAPFTLVNLAIGASGIRFVDFAVGTLIGMGPGLVVMCFVGSRMAEIVDNPSVQHIAWLLVGAAAWAGMALLAQKLVGRLGGASTKEPA